MPDIRPFRALRFDRRGDRRPAARSSPRPTTSSARTSSGRCWPGTRATPSASTCRGRARRGARRAVPARGAHAGRLAVGRDAAQGPAPRRLRLRAGLSRARARDVERTQRGFFARLRIEPFGPERRRPAARADAVRAQGGPLPAPARDGHQHVAGRRPVRGPGGRAATALVARRGAAARSSTSRTTTASATGCGWSPVDGPEGVAERLAAAAGAGPVFIADGHHRYETALRYRDERRMTRSCEEDPAFDFLLMLFLDAADASSRSCRRTAWCAASGRTGSSGLAPTASPGCSRSRRRRPEALVARFEAAGELAGGEGRIGLVTRDGAWLLEARDARRSPRLPAVATRSRALDVTLLGDRPRRARGHRRRRRRRRGADPLHEVGGRGRGLVADGDGRRRCRVPPRAHAGRVDPRRRARRRRDAPEVDLLLPKALTGLVLNPHEW